MATLLERPDLIAMVASVVREVDPRAKEAVLFGSSAYAPHLAGDLDVAVLTAASDRDTERLAEQLTQALVNAVGSDVDAFVYAKPLVQQRLGALALGILAGRRVFGGDELLRAAFLAYEGRGGDVRSFSEARAHLRRSEAEFRDAAREVALDDRTVAYSAAFDHLFHAARVAAAVYARRESGTWGGLSAQLPDTLGAEFEHFISVLHKRCGYGDGFNWTLSKPCMTRTGTA